MTEEEKNEAALWDQVLDLIPAPFRGRVAVLENSVVYRPALARRVKILASINRRRDGYENDVVIMNRWPWRPVPDTAEGIARALTDAAFEAVLGDLPLLVAPPLELDEKRENILWAPTGETWAALTRFEDAADLALYATRITGFKYRGTLVSALREALKGQSVTVVWEPGGITVRRKDRTVVIHGDEPMASILLRGGKYGDQGRTVAGADYGVIRDEDLLAPAVSFLRFEA